MRHDAIVVGGGLAGLAGAALLGRAGLRVALLEKSANLGGRARTNPSGEFRFNLGPHALYRSGAGVGVLRELGVRFRGGVPRAGAVVRDGRVLSPTAALGVGGFLDLARVVVSGRAPGPDESLRAWLDAEVREPRLREALEMLARVTTYAHAPERMAAAAALAQVKRGLLGGVLYLDGGWQTLVDGLRAAAQAASVEFVTARRVERVEHTGGEFAVDDLRAGAVLLAVDPGTAAALTGLSWPVTPVRAAVLDLALERLPRPRVPVALGLDRPVYLSTHSAFARLAPEGAALVSLLRYLGPGETGSAAELEDLMDLVQPGWRDVLVERRFMPSLTVAGDLPEAGRAWPSVEAVPGLYLAGDWVGGEGLLADASLASARAAARAIAARLREARCA